MTSSGDSQMQRWLMRCASGVVLALAGAPAFAQQTGTPQTGTPQADAARPGSEAGEDALRRLEESMAQQAARLDAQARELDRQRAELAQQQQALNGQIEELARLKATTANQPADQSSTASLSGLAQEAYASLRAGQTPPNATASNIQAPLVPPAPAPDPEAPMGPVGAPPPPRPRPELEAIPDNVGVLTASGRIVVEPSFEFANFSSNRLVFRGVEIIPGIQIGLIEASDVDRNSLIGTLALRAGLTDRIEVQLRAPYVYRNDEILTLAQRDETITRSVQLEGHDMGDLEVSGRYQLNSGRNGSPVWVANLRYKSNTGKSPFEVGRDENGIATELATGSGFWGIEPGVTWLMASDPAVLYADFSYLYHAPDDIDRVINGVLIGRVDPGDSINASLGFGFAVNQRFSFSLGYRHTYVTQTESELGATRQSSDELQVGTMQMGLSWRLNDRTALNSNFEFGATRDAPNVRVVFRVPFG
jgi:hypothetical protein